MSTRRPKKNVLYKAEDARRQLRSTTFFQRSSLIELPFFQFKRPKRETSSVAESTRFNLVMRKHLLVIEPNVNMDIIGLFCLSMENSP